jgi:cysteinyl-tRNA synthetase
LIEKIRESNRELDAATLAGADAQRLLSWWEGVNQALAISGGEAQVPPEITALVEQRAQARLEKNWRAGDELRDRIAALGWEVRDTKDGQKVTRRGGA